MPLNRAEEVQEGKKSALLCPCLYWLTRVAALRNGASSSNTVPSVTSRTCTRPSTTTPDRTGCGFVHVLSDYSDDGGIGHGIPDRR